jgi:hypothetical protein
VTNPPLAPDVTLAICDMPNDDVRDTILAPLAAFNAHNGYPADHAVFGRLDSSPRDNARMFLRKRLDQA